MRQKNVAVRVLAVILLPIALFCAYGFGVFMYIEDVHVRDDFTPEQQREIAATLGYDIAPGETLTVRYYADVWPGTVHMIFDDNYGEHFWLNITDEQDAPAIKKVQGMINNLWLPYVMQCILWGGVALEAALVAALIISRRRAKKHPVGDGVPDVPGQ